MKPHNERPMSMTQGAMVIGPMKFVRKPMRPKHPNKTCTNEAKIIPPDTYRIHENRMKYERNMIKILVKESSFE